MENMKSHMKFRRSSGVEGEMVEEEEFVGTGEVVRIEKTEEVSIILAVIAVIFMITMICVLLVIFIIITSRFRTSPSVMKTL